MLQISLRDHRNWETKERESYEENPTAPER